MGLKLLAMLAAMLCPVGAALAADLGPTFPAPQPPAPPPALSGDWKVQLTLYGWATALTGDVGLRGLPTTDVDMAFTDILGKLDGALMGSLIVSNDRFVLLTDLVWAKLSDKVDAGPFGGSVSYDQTQLIAQAAVGYILPLGNPSLQLSPTIGLRYNHLKAELEIDPAILPASISRDQTKAWLDPTVGLFMRYDLDPKWFVNAMVDIGGFGIGSDFTSQGFASIGYRWTPSVSTALGYRAIYTDYRDGGFVYDTTMHGPFASLAVTF
jgi:hypothetical protein